MWISKKMWNDMCNRIDELEKRQTHDSSLSAETRSLCFNLANLHGFKSAFTEHKWTTEFNEYDKMYTKMDDNALNHEQVYFGEITADTDQVKDIILQELARLVMDGEPIVRKTMEEKTNYYGRKVD